MDRAYDSSSAGQHKDAIRIAPKVIKLLPQMGPGMAESEFAYYMYSVRAWSKYEIEDIKGACADWRKEVSLSNNWAMDLKQMLMILFEMNVDQYTFISF